MGGTTRFMDVRAACGVGGVVGAAWGTVEHDEVGDAGTVNGRAV
jgi:hypothetical protein